MWLGFWRVEVAPSSKFHDQAVGLFVDVSVNWNVAGAACASVGVYVKFATGALAGACTTTVPDALEVPFTFATINWIGKVPTWLNV
ncbi:hypothetical protein DSECCO2_426160 [anaerobic digester metagenome]